MGHPVGLGEPVGHVHGDGLRVALCNELCELVEHLVAITECPTISVAVARDGAGKRVGAPHIDSVDGSGSAKGRSLDSVLQVCEDQVAVGGPELRRHGVRIAFTRDMDPHGHVVVAHGARENEVELGAAELA